MHKNIFATFTKHCGHYGFFEIQELPEGVTSYSDIHKKSFYIDINNNPSDFIEGEHYIIDLNDFRYKGKSTWRAINARKISSEPSDFIKKSNRSYSLSEKGSNDSYRKSNDYIPLSKNKKRYFSEDNEEDYSPKKRRLYKNDYEYGNSKYENIEFRNNQDERGRERYRSPCNLRYDSRSYSPNQRTRGYNSQYNEDSRRYSHSPTHNYSSNEYRMVQDFLKKFQNNY